MSASMSLLLFLSFTASLSAIDIDNEKTRLVRRLQEEEADPTNMPTRSPSAGNCAVAWAGESLNPSDIDMALVTTTAGTHDIDLEAGDTNLDGDNARIGLCQVKFGSSSKPVYPENEDVFTGMVNLCESLGGGNECYMGLYRKDYNNQAEDCDVWRGEDATASLSTSALSNYGNGWSNNQPSCPWLQTTDSRYDASITKHCVTYKTNSNKIRVQRCTSDVHIVCTYHGVCN